MATTVLPLDPPPPISPRFTLELEFVLCLSNPQYLQHLASTYPHLLNPPLSISKQSDENSDSACFARYLAYLYEYWRKPKYSQYLTHPGAVLRNLELLQLEQFRKDIIRPDVIARLLETGPTPEAAGANVDHTQEVVGDPTVEARSGEITEGEQMDTTAG